jgi:glucose-1-phosphate thymidylyltransferase
MPATGDGQKVVYCFEDSRVNRLVPAVTARPAYAITCGSFRLIDWLQRLDATLIGDCRSHLRTIQSLDYGINYSREAIQTRSPTLLVNARIVPTVTNFRRLQGLVDSAQPALLLDQEGAVAAAYSPRGLPNDPLAGGGPIEPLIERLVRDLPPASDAIETFRWPHEIVAQHMRAIGDSLAWRIEHGEYTQTRDGLFVAPGVTLGDHLVIDSSKGPIVIESQAKIGPFCYLAGPVHIGRAARINEHAALKDAVALGHTTKVGGEVEASVIEPYSNKQHHGFLGHSYLGSWINLGAGTCNSDLKNTYGTINMEYGTERVATDMQFMGCVMGDYSKTAINTGIFTGKVVGVCSMLYGFVTSNVPSFVNYARLFGQTETLPPDVMISTQARMFARRQVTQRDCDRQLLIEMFDLTQEERMLQASIGL